jgi:hypothetical protein
MKKLRFKTCFMGTLFLSVFFAACTLEAPREEASSPDIPEGAGRVKVSLTLEGRTALPEIGDLSRYALAFTLSGETEPAVTETITETSLTRELEPGAYTLVVTGYDRSNTALAEGSAEFTVTANGEISVSVSLRPTQKGTGTLSYTISLPEALTLETGILQLVSLSGGTNVSLDLSGESGLSGSRELTAGYYRAGCDLYGTIEGNFKHAGKTTIVHIYDNLTTVVPFSFEANELSNDGIAVVGSSEEFMAALTEIGSSEVSDVVIYVEADLALAPIDLSGTGYSGKTIRLRSDGSRKISLSGNGALFTVGSGVSFEVEQIELTGKSGNTSGLVRVSGGTFMLRTGGTISGNTASSSSSYGGGVYVSSGTFEMSGGTISGNTASSSSPSSSYSYGGGVYVYSSGTFTKAPKDGSSTSGVIYGSDAAGADATGKVLKNTASYGSAVYGGSSSRQRNTTVGETTSLSTGNSANWTD